MMVYCSGIETKMFPYVKHMIFGVVMAGVIGSR